MNRKQVMLLTSENFDIKERKKVYKKGNKVKIVFSMIMIALLISCVSVNEMAVCSAKETTKTVSEKKKTSKKVSKKNTKARKKKVSKKSAKARKKKSSQVRYTVYGTPSGNSFKSYMSYRAVSSSSTQGKLQGKARTDSKTGIRKVDGRYCVALGSYYCSKIGTKFDLVMSNGSIVKCILGDQKANRDTDAKNQKTSDGSIAEFLVDMDKLPSKVKTMGDVSYADKKLKGNIAKIRVYEK